MPELAYVNGSFCDLDQATVSVEDRGFQFADAVYEVLVAYGQTVFRIKDHLERLRRSLTLIDMSGDLERMGLQEIIHEGVRRAGFDETVIYVQVTRGRQPRGHVYSPTIKPTVVVTFKANPQMDPAIRARGVSVMTIEDFRWSRCEIKSVTLLPNVMAKNRARRDGFHEAIFVSAAGEIREATSANVFAVRDGALITPGIDGSILHGITRLYILQCAKDAGIECREIPLTVAELESADEAFLSSTAIDILPITKVNGKLIADGTPGPVTQSLHRAFVAGLPKQP